MGVVEAKLTVKKDEAPSSPPNSMEVVSGELASLKLQEKPAAGVGAPEIAAAADDAGLLDQDPESPKKGEEEASEKGVWPGFPRRPDEPDCAFFMKTGTCKFGLNCKFNHPPKRRRHRAKSKKQPEDVQAAKEVYVGSGTKLMGQPTRKVVEKEKKIAQKCFRHENVEVKQKGKPLKKVEKTEKKAVEEQKQTPCKGMEQEDYKAKLKKQWKVAQGIKKDHEESNSKMMVQTAYKNGEENLKGILLKTVEQTEKKVVEEKQTLPKMAEQKDNNAVVEKQNISEKMEQQDNKFHTMPGGWKYAKSCKFVHSQKKIEAGSLELNFLGLPIRLGEKECPFYMRTGNCKFSTNCKYHHPDPTVAIVGQDPLSGYQDSAPTQQIAFGASPLAVTPCPTQGTFGGPTFIVASPSYPPESILHSQRFHSNSECNGYQVNIDEHPERPGQPECHHFMKNGVCRFGSACKFHHPKVHLPFPTNSIGTFIPNYPSQ